MLSCAFTSKFDSECEKKDLSLACTTILIIYFCRGNKKMKIKLRNHKHARKKVGAVSQAPTDAEIAYVHIM